MLENGTQIAKILFWIILVPFTLLLGGAFLAYVVAVLKDIFTKTAKDDKKDKSLEIVAMVVFVLVVFSCVMIYFSIFSHED